ncbi:putative ribosome-binding factor A, mitochondrial [Anabrus simplex]|uniref:putative ribosome-binding factor A, mitochondrial n=1 Tax=Anabrus simplex TaxID=316456 RepID=UPI0035A27CD9
MYFRGVVGSVRHFSLCHSLFNKYSTREGRMIQKLMKGSLQKKKNWYKAEKQASYLPSPQQSSFQKGNRVTKRMAVLNKLFMKNITDLMATGEIAGEVLGRGISISRVKVSPDYNIINVYWLAKGTEDDVTTEKILSDAAYSLRHELSQLHVMGVVPKIKFVKDKQYAIIAEVDHLLGKADFGDEYEPLDPASYLKSEFTLSGSVLPHVQDQINQCTDEENDEEPLPPMRMDVLGLDHAEIMNKICKSVKKSEAVHRRNPNLPVDENVGNAEENKQDADVKCQNSSIVKFIQKQKIMKEKKRRQEKKYQQDKDLLACEIVNNTANDDWDSKEENDYVDEIEDTHRL